MTPLTKAFAYLVLHWGSITFILGAFCSFLSTLATMTTDHPKTDSFLHTVIGILSWVEHADIGGTKLPFLARVRKPGAPAVSAPPAALLLLGCLALGTFWSGCAHVTPLEQSLIDCGESAIAQEATAAGPQVIAILNGGSVNWATQLTVLLQSGGAGVICAVQAIVSSLTGKAAALAPGEELALVRAQAWLDSVNAKAMHGAGVVIQTK